MTRCIWCRSANICRSNLLERSACDSSSWSADPVRRPAAGNGRAARAEDAAADLLQAISRRVPPGERPAWLVNVTSGWFGIARLYQHFQSRVLAIAEGLPFARRQYWNFQIDPVAAC